MKLILGNGRTAQSVAQFLKSKNISFMLLKDTRTVKNKSVLQGVDEIFISPGIPQTQNIVVWASKQNIPISSDIALFSRYTQAPIIGITGSNGKSTVTQLLGEMIANDGKKVAVGGNIGIPALDCLDESIEYYVLELSSYQLDYTKHLKLHTGVVLNITPDHLDRYPSFKHYVDSKLSLYQHCQYPVINQDEPLIPKLENANYFGIDIPKQSNDFGTVTCHGSCYFLKGNNSLMNTDDMSLIGTHNVSNVLAALTLGNTIGLNIDSMIATIKTFKGLEHRLEQVVKKHNVDYYNDSKATNAIATITALNALADKYQNIVLIAGGIKKQEDYSALFKLIDDKVSHVVLIGQSAQALGSNIHCAKVHHVNALQAAINTASTLIDNGAILFSPACASFDMFNDFEHRGQVFKDCVNNQAHIKKAPN